MTIPAHVLQLLKLINRGGSLQDAAQQTGYTIGTIRTYIKRLYPAFGVSKRHELIVRLRHLGVLATPKTNAAGPRWLTPVRRRLLTMARSGMTQAQIARALHLPRQHNVDRAFGYIRKRLGVATTDEAVDVAVAAGWLPTTKPARWQANPLTEFESGILDGLALRWTAKEIAEDLGAQASSVYNRIRRLRAKLRVATNEELVDAAERLGLYQFAAPRARARRSAVRAIASHRRPEPLSPREEEVAAALRRWPNHTLDWIGDRLGITVHTVQAHLFRIRRHYAVRSREELQERLRR